MQKVEGSIPFSRSPDNPSRPGISGSPRDPGDRLLPWASRASATRIAPSPCPVCALSNGGHALIRRVEKFVSYPALSEITDLQRREFREALLDADTFEDLTGKWQAAILKAEQNRPDLPIVGSGPRIWTPTQSAHNSRRPPTAPPARPPTLRSLFGSSLVARRRQSGSGGTAELFVLQCFVER
jgi:hypothetical protein